MYGFKYDISLDLLDISFLSKENHWSKNSSKKLVNQSDTLGTSL